MKYSYKKNVPAYFLLKSFILYALNWKSTNFRKFQKWFASLGNPKKKIAKQRLILEAYVLCVCSFLKNVHIQMSSPLPLSTTSRIF